MQLVAALLQAKERADPQGWLTFQVGVTSVSRDVPLPTGLLALHARASQMHLAAVFESNNAHTMLSHACCSAAAATIGLQTEVSALKLQRTRVEREADDLQVCWLWPIEVLLP